ncbi:NADH oxidase [Streptomyces spinoverrucosus]|uniref:NADH oxidase n=1 Tax=Streptomyces spinoverrucosus TaxID=284043 RepID=A0A4Y3VN75_9ACTN|nr:nitroreductase family protein [Streptomyces spinoverrucosus]GEC08023.1 NADH oxidase [Streptomyces spinoverrucosus]GHB89109.1 NADH oxidase [Streptomyces spinoverrucosus]
MGYAHEYATAIMHRGRVPMEPADFVPDWADRPRKAKYYPGAESFPLPDTTYPSHATVTAGCLPDGNSGEALPFSLPLLSGMLLDSYGLVGRRLGVQANTDLGALPHYPQANWSRGTASGGGLYPVSVYWVSGPSGPLAPGAHYYSPPHHAMQRLLAGDVSGEVRAALGAHGEATDQYLVLGVKYWQNAFKYNSFSFHAVSMDVGALLQTWHIWARARGLRLAPALWFDEARLSRLLGLGEDEEGLFAVVPLLWDTQRSTSDAPESVGAAVTRQDLERSRTVLDFDTLRRIHRATAEHATDRPAPGALDSSAPAALAGTADPVALPSAALPEVSLRAALRARRSSFGRFDATVPVTAAQLATTLAACAEARLHSDAEPDGTPRLARLYAFVNHVDGVEPGAYAYEPGTHTLQLVVPGAPGSFLQRNYFLSNYNLEQAAAVIVPAMRTTAVLDAVGDRGYRLVNATVGAIAQTFYTAAAALGLGAGVALGFDNISYIEELGLENSGEAPLLIMLLGNERPQPADFRSDIA